MASLRKRHQSHADSDAPVSTPPPAAEPAASAEPAPPLPEAPKTASPADEAGKNAIQQRLAEMENAQTSAAAKAARACSRPDGNQ
jgi:hypothetical protein